MWKGETGLQTHSLNIGGVQFPCKVKLLVDSVTIYAGMGFEYVKVGSLSAWDSPQIVEIREDNASRLWGRLKSSAGWIPLSETKLL